MVFSSSEGLSESRFDAGEESGVKADPQQVAVDMRNARTEENKQLKAPVEKGRK